jgi:hypothetical protein
MAGTTKPLGIPKALAQSLKFHKTVLTLLRRIFKRGQESTQPNQPEERGSPPYHRTGETPPRSTRRDLHQESPHLPSLRIEEPSDDHSETGGDTSQYAPTRSIAQDARAVLNQALRYNAPGVGGNEINTRAPANSGPWIKVKWAERDRRLLYKYIEELRKYNLVLDQLVSLKPPTGELPVSDKKQEELERLRKAVNTAQSALIRLRRALREMNSPSRPWFFAIQLTTNFEEEGRLFAENYVSAPYSNGKHFCFNLQRMKTESGAEPELFVAQTFLKPGEHLSEPAERMVNLDQAEAFRNICHDAFATWGLAVEHDKSTDVHRIYKDCVKQRRSHDSLEGLLLLLRRRDAAGTSTTTTSSSSSFTPAQRVSLAVPLTAAHLYLDFLPLVHASLDALLYFTLRGEPANRSLITRPYLSLGFGQRHANDAIVGGPRPAAGNAALALVVALARVGQGGDGGGGHD